MKVADILERDCTVDELGQTYLTLKQLVAIHSESMLEKRTLRHKVNVGKLPRELVSYESLVSQPRHYLPV